MSAYRAPAPLPEETPSFDKPVLRRLFAIAPARIVAVGVSVTALLAAVFWYVVPATIVGAVTTCVYGAFFIGYLVWLRLRLGPEHVAQTRLRIETDSDRLADAELEEEEVRKVLGR